ncbi:phage portal protein [Streptomyces sp. UNOC14_S4]|uniref:phage portal protein n=1 Tax=Streptomyces sp. UNOC14_S4 TaxID=2872340 RepID=UPI001E39A7F2|nr:phage portal protein [Streptomyces sp. UNOC14_S4]MCC3766061.1 phage portal protein [Streptomyces sp. UNOC14_S4]
MSCLTRRDPPVEFEVHGQRLSRYSTNWAFYLGFHHSYRREAGETQNTINYVGALARYVNHFTFGRGIHFEVKRKYEHIVPALLRRAWEEDNDKKSLLYEIGENGGVTGDSFVKVAYEEAWTDGAGREHPGRVRILPLSSAHVFPEWHPHDRGKMIRCRVKYRFFGTTTEGTRTTFTYVEELTDDRIKEFINDDLVDDRPNPLGIIPIAHIKNIAISGSPWGKSDIDDIIPLNREYNNVTNDIADIVNYHAAPTTVITGAKATNLEKGARKLWGGLPKDASVFNLENGVDLKGPLEYLDVLKNSMHELVGVPATALGAMQPVSNTSGVALAIQFQPLVQRASLKQMQFTLGFKRVNELILLTLFTHEPETLKYDPETGGIKKDGQPFELDPKDPEIYKVDIVWPTPLPVDNLVKLNEIQLKMALGLESKRSALYELGEEFPDEKLAEIETEQKQDALAQGALEFIHAAIATGIFGSPDGTTPDNTQSKTDSKVPNQSPKPTDSGISLKFGMDAKKIMDTVVTMAHGTKLPQRQQKYNQTDTAA